MNSLPIHERETFLSQVKSNTELKIASTGSSGLSAGSSGLSADLADRSQGRAPGQRQGQGQGQGQGQKQRQRPAQDPELAHEQAHVTRLYERLDVLRELARQRLNAVHLGPTAENEQGWSERESFAEEHRERAA